MCGIGGIAGISSTSAFREEAEKMSGALSHRGPDDSGITELENEIFIHRRLSVIDPDKRSAQPMLAARGRYLITYNGEVYNFHDLRAELKDYPFKTQSDTEVILAAFEKWGIDAVSKFEGMFALAVFDKQEKEVLLFRDRLGIKPVYYHIYDGILTFSSEIRAMLKGGRIPAKLNRKVLPEFLFFQTVHCPRTLITDVYLLPPGSLLRFRNGKSEIHQWWEPDSVKHSETDRKSAEEKIRELLYDSVSKRMLSDVPLGAFLSGGIDSSAIVGIMADSSDSKVDTFSVVFDEQEFDESEWSSAVAEKFGTRHHPVHLKGNDLLEKLPAALSAMDHPGGDGINSYVVSAVTRKQGIKVALSGLGGDELFGGYPFFNQIPAILSKRWLFMLPPYARKGLANMYAFFKTDRQGHKLSDILQLGNHSVEGIYPGIRSIYTRRDLKILRPRLEIEEWPGLSGNLPQFNCQNPCTMSRISWADIRSYTQNVLLRDTDQMSMAHGLEVRVPFFDHKLVEYVLSLPDKIKKGKTPKSLLVDSLQGLLPDEVVNRKKMGFVFPWENWLKNELHSFGSERIYSLEQRRLFVPGGPVEIWDSLMQGDKNIRWLHAWLLIVLETWIRKNNIDCEPA